jgi:hypothetical protein
MRPGGRTGPTAGETGPPVAVGRAGQPTDNVKTITFPTPTMHLKNNTERQIDWRDVGSDALRVAVRTAGSGYRRPRRGNAHHEAVRVAPVSRASAGRRSSPCVGTMTATNVLGSRSRSVSRYRHTCDGKRLAHSTSWVKRRGSSIRHVGPADPKPSNLDAVSWRLVGVVPIRSDAKYTARETKTIAVPSLACSLAHCGSAIVASGEPANYKSSEVQPSCQSQACVKSNQTPNHWSVALPER